MKENLQQALTYILASEGSKPNISPNEPGGASKFGVSVTALSDLRRHQGKPPVSIEDVSALTEQEARDFYEHDFAAFIRFNELPLGVDYRLLDIAINLGKTGGVKALEVALGNFPVTGKMSDAIVAKVSSSEPKELIRTLGAVWLAKKHDSLNWPKYGRGWTNRNLAANDHALKMVG